MTPEKPHIDFVGLVAKYLGGNATDDETTRLEVLIKEDQEKLHSFNQIKSIWRLSSAPRRDFNEKKGWESITRQLPEFDSDPLSSSKITNVIRLQKNVRVMLRYAAILILLAIGTWSVYYFTSKTTDTLVASSEPIHLELKDGSTVSVNAQGAITIPKRFRKERRITLDGEAFFDVTPIPEMPFIIDANGIIVRVTGTSFNVKSLINEPLVEVAVIEGTVEIMAPGAPLTHVGKGQIAIYNRTDSTLVVNQEIDPNLISWKTRILVFEDVMLEKVFSTLGDKYNLEFQLKDEKLRNCRLTATFENKSINDILTIIQETFGLTYSRTGETIWVSGKGCEP